MKVLFSFLTVLPLVSGWSSPASPVTRPVSSALHMASTTVRPPNWDDYPVQHDRRVETKGVVERKVSWMERQAMKDAVIDPDYTLTIGLAALAPLIFWYHPHNPDGSMTLLAVCGGLFHMLFAALLWVQTARVRCVFEKDGFEFYNIKGPGLDLEKGAYLERKPNNYVADTRNRWKYDTITNYGFFPSEEFPVICYFKETETPKWKWNRWFAAFDSYQRGQPHFFPGICNVRQFKREMEKRGVQHKPIPTYRNKNHANQTIKK